MYKLLRAARVMIRHLVYTVFLISNVILVTSKYNSVTLLAKVEGPGFFSDAKMSPAARPTNAKHSESQLQLGDISHYCSTMTGFNPSACRADGSLKDPSEITFYHDADNDDIPLPPSGMQPASSNAFSVLLNSGWQVATFVAGARRSGRPAKPSARLRDADNLCRMSSSARKRALSSAADVP
ncbi:uncharacterized protein EDB93DRAFT_1245838 [Suillus bovinus]|uniref:uncharacterized protein n=1 Tax=Suillus bovinus TaxID=48563 RepID=UPI001B864968|nr:uncharacterized protein EDB93DRAFT_1245838 [Suillus bovinus]KAG2158615.1 hypothetical protein EDB93DRAFT_1245838 [Suillus bovinus]